MAATKPSSATPSSLNFLKEGLLLQGGNRRLFMAIFALLVPWTSLLLAANELGIEPLKLEVVRDVDALMSTDPGSPGYARLLRETQDDNRILLLAAAAFLVFADVTGSVIQLVSLVAAVTTYSGEVHTTLGALLAGARTQLKGAVRTVAFVCALKTAAVALLSASSALLASLAFRRCYGLSLAGGCLLLLVAFVLYIFLSFICSLAVVVAVDDQPAAGPGRRHGASGAGAVGRAWQLVKGRQRRAMLFVSVMSVLGAVFRPLYWLAQICARSDMASGALLLGVLYAVQMAAVGLFQDCALTAFYYECKGSSRSAQAQDRNQLRLSTSSCLYKMSDEVPYQLRA